MHGGSYHGPPVMSSAYGVKIVWTLASAVVALIVGAIVVGSILADAEMLTGALGPWGLLLYLVVPALVAGAALRERWRRERDLPRPVHERIRDLLRHVRD